MTLNRYREKRRFDDTPEPAGEQIKGAFSRRFVVQKHRASHLHYDFRLELDGVLKSWAVPKGPSMDPADKRLAMMVEDHPLDYRTFEGTIPAGNYGAGTVMVWDEGTYSPRQDREGETANADAIREGLEKGHLTFILQGAKLQGEFALLKLRRGEPNAWLLVKADDEHAGRLDIREDDRSALTGRSMDEIAQGAPSIQATSSEPETDTSTLDLSDAPHSELPHGLRPMLATPVKEPFDCAGWLFEIKWDGYRAIAEVTAAGVEIHSRTGKDFTTRYPSIVHALRGFRHEAVLDGEIVALGDDGKPSFGRLHQGAAPSTLMYYVFDLLYLDGHDLRQLPLCRRKELLSAVLPFNPTIKLSDHIERKGRSFFRAVSESGLEGMIAKKADSRYLDGHRSEAWQKVKTQRRQDVVIAGYTTPRGTRTDLGALVTGVCEDQTLRYAGHVGTGFDEATLRHLRAVLDPLAVDTSPFDVPPATNAPVQWVRPEIVCSVSFREWTEDGSMRHPVFLRLRDDVSPGDARRDTEEPASPPPLPADPAPAQRRRFALHRKGDESVAIDGQALKLTNLDKVYWPDDGYTKRDLVTYYRGIAPVILPYLRGRPESMHRHPDGITGESFFQKDVSGNPPEWAETIDLLSESDDREITYLVCNDEATLAYMANLGCIELNPWNSRVETPDNPDYLVIDLDPERIAFERVVEVALEVRRVLDSAGVEGWCKTSGATGLHIYVPLAARYSYEQARGFAQIIATLVHGRLPEITSLERSPARRQGKVYLDYLQNRHGQTLAAPYSVRPRVGAPVSTPLRWEEVVPGLDPGIFTIRTIQSRLDKVGDLWQPLLGTGADIARALDALTDAGTAVR